MLTWVMESYIGGIIVYNVVCGGVDSRLRKVDSTEASEKLVNVLLNTVPGGLPREEGG